MCGRRLWLLTSVMFVPHNILVCYPQTTGELYKLPTLQQHPRAEATVSCKIDFFLKQSIVWKDASVFIMVEWHSNTLSMASNIGAFFVSYMQHFFILCFDRRRIWIQRGSTSCRGFWNWPSSWTQLKTPSAPWRTSMCVEISSNYKPCWFWTHSLTSDYLLSKQLLLCSVA